MIIALANELLDVQACMRTSSIEEMFNLWHRRLGHVHFQDLLKLSTQGTIRGISKLSGRPDKVCGGCEIGKQARSAHRSIKATPTTQAMELLRMDLMGPSQTQSCAGKSYILVVVDDFTRFTLVNFLADKGDTFESFKGLSYMIKKFQTICGEDNGTELHDNDIEFKNNAFENDIFHEFLAPVTPQ